NGDHPLTIVAQVSLAGTAPNAIPTLKDPNNETVKDLWDALERQMRGSEYGEQDRKAVINDLKKCGYKKDNCVLNYKILNNLQPRKQYGTLMWQTKNLMDINIDALGYKKKAVVVTSDPLALVAEKTKVSKRKEKVEVQTESEGSDDEDITSFSGNKKPEYVKSVEKKEDKKADEKKRDMSKVKYYNYKKERHFAKDCKKAKEINANMVFMAKMENVLSDSDESSSSAEETIAEVAYYTSESKRESEYENSEYYNNYTNYGLFVNDNDDQNFFHDAIESASENFIENHIDSQKDYNKSEVDHNDYEEKDHLVDKLIRKFNHMIAKLNPFEEQKYEFNEQMKVLNEKNADLLAQTKILQDQLKVKHVLIDRHTECQAQYAKLTEERNEYMIRYSALCDNDKQHRKKIDEQEILFDTISRFENPSYFEKAKDLRPSLYDEKVIGLGYNSMFLTHSNEALEIEKFKRARENRIEFAYDYRNLNASYVNEKQTSSLKPYVPTVILEKIIIDLEDEVVSLLEKEKANLELIESLKSKGFESSENAISESKNQSENDCQVVEKCCDQVENSKVIAPGMFKRNRTLVEATRNMLTFANLPLFLWAEAIATACFTQNHSIIHKRFDKTPYELMNKRKPNIKFFHVFGCRCYLLNDYDDVGKLKAKVDIGVFAGYSKESDAFKIYNKRTRKIHESVNVNFDEIMKYLTTNVETSNVEIPSNEEEVFHESSESFQEESSSSSLNDDVHQSLEEVVLPSSNTQSVSNNMVPNVDEASTSHNVFNERLEDAYFDASTLFHDPSNVNTFYQPYPHEKKWTKDHSLHKIIGDPKLSVRIRAQLANSCLFSCLLSSIETANVAEALRDADWVSAMQEELNQFARVKVWRLVHRPEVKTIIKTKWIFKNKKDESSLTSFLNEILKEEVYFGQPTGFVRTQYPDLVYALDKFVWFETSTSGMVRRSFIVLD
nr:retrovirus-related Pol polyprotein from transposon TNT 1-94 [Tanacetum cinerariifolium]